METVNYPIGEKSFQYNFASEGSQDKNFNRKPFARKVLNRPTDFNDSTNQILLLLIDMFSYEMKNALLAKNALLVLRSDVTIGPTDPALQGGRGWGEFQSPRPTLRHCFYA